MSESIERQGAISSIDEDDDNYAAWEAGLARIETRLKREHPELFDESGKLIPAEAMRVIRERTDGKTTFTGTEFRAIFGTTGRTAD